MLDLRASDNSTCCCPEPSFTGHLMHGAGQGSNEHSGEAGRSRNNDWMTHHLSQQQPLAQWIQDRQKAFADFSQSLISPINYSTPDTVQDYWPRPQLEWQTSSPTASSISSLHHHPVKANKMLSASNTAELSPKAKVSYDEGQFVVEIPLKDYRVSCKYLHYL